MGVAFRFLFSLVLSCMIHTASWGVKMYNYRTQCITSSNIQPLSFARDRPSVPSLISYISLLDRSRVFALRVGPRPRPSSHPATGETATSPRSPISSLPQWLSTSHPNNYLGICLNPLTFVSSSSSKSGSARPLIALNGSPSSKRSITFPSSVSRLHSVVSNIPLGVGLKEANRITPVRLVPFTLNFMSMRPCSWFISPEIHGIWALK